MKLTEEQKELVKALVKHPGFTIIEMIEEDASNKLGQTILKADLTNENQLKILRENQIYVKARKDFLENIKKQTLNIYENEIKLY